MKSRRVAPWSYSYCSECLFIYVGYKWAYRPIGYLHKYFTSSACTNKCLNTYTHLGVTPLQRRYINVLSKLNSQYMLHAIHTYMNFKCIQKYTCMQLQGGAKNRTNHIWV